MKVPITSIGNSKGIILNKNILEEYNIREYVELVMKEEHIVIKPVTNPREGWGEQFKKMHHEGDDRLLIDDGIE